jgi:hypothetical protein
MTFGYKGNLLAAAKCQSSFKGQAHEVDKIRMSVFGFWILDVARWE